MRRLPCTTFGCPGLRPDIAFSHCVGHMDADDVADYGKQLAGGGTLEAEGAQLTAARFHELVAFLDVDRHGRPEVRANLRGATFDDELEVYGQCWIEVSAVDAHFQGPVYLDIELGQRSVDLSAATFAGAAIFDLDAPVPGSLFATNKTIFEDEAKVRIRGEAGSWVALGARFGGNLEFSVVLETALLGGSVAAQTARMYASRVQVLDAPTEVGDLIVKNAQIGKGSFSTRVNGRAEFSRVVGDHLAFDGFTVGDSADLDNIFAGVAEFTDARFLGSVWLMLTGRQVFITKSRFMDPANLAISADELSLDSTGFDSASTIVGLVEPGTPGVDDRRLAVPSHTMEWELERDAEKLFTNGRPVRPTRLVSADRARLEHVEIDDLDLSACPLRTVLGLEGLRIGRGCKFASSPIAPKRIVLADEVVWRAARRGLDRPWLPKVAELARRHQYVLDKEKLAEQTASAYRALRAGLEDRKDQVGASDFYYGEMEMRRSRRSLDRLVLTAYWLTSGYGTRPGRAALTLVAIVALLGALFWACGFDPRHGKAYLEAVLYAAKAASNTLQRPERDHLSDAGDVFVILARVLGPVGVGFLAFALRAKVKR